MFHIRHSCIFIITLVVLVLVVVFLQTHSLQVDVMPGDSQHDSEKIHLAEAAVTDASKFRIKSSKRRKIPFLRENISESTDFEATPKPIDHTKLIQSLDTKLLEDHELREGEASDTEREAADIVIKYDNGMFGLLDSDSNLHVWRTSFPTIGEVWPHPLSVVTTKHLFTLCPRSNSLSFKLTGSDNYIIQKSIKRYINILCERKVSFYPSNWRQQEHLLDEAVLGKYIFKNKPTNRNRNVDSSPSSIAILKGEIRSINVVVENEGHQWPSLYMNESYKLSVNVKGIFIRARETWGVLRALESVSQLAWRTRRGRVFINETKIVDQPRFKHRGIMLDTARHFFSKEVIMKNLDAMEMNKMNVFHWHLSDDQSFPLITENHPEFAKHGAYDFKSKVYRPEDVREIVEYARQRGIRVIPEIDSPSHTLSWRKSHPEVMTRCIDLNGKWSGYYGPLNMASKSTYRLLKSLFTDIVNLFPDQWIHLGSDEVATSCILSNQAIQNWMQSKGMYSVDLLTDFYMRKLQNIITEIGKKSTKLQRGYIVWQEAYDRNSALKKGTIVQMWKSQSTSEAAMLARQGISVIYSSCWYLDRLEYGAQWVAHYQCDPGDDVGSMLMINDFGNTHSSENWRDFILGGEAAMWTEFLDSDNVLPRIWPLASAAAERLWSPSSINNAENAAPRLEEMRCRLMIRSIPTGVAGGAGDCGQSIEGNVFPSSQYKSLHNSDIDTSNLSSFLLMSQLLVNLFRTCRTFLLLVLILAVALCIYLQRNLRLSTRRLMVVVTVSLSLYTLVWILSQHMLLH